MAHSDATAFSHSCKACSRTSAPKIRRTLAHLSVKRNPLPLNKKRFAIGQVRQISGNRAIFGAVVLSTKMISLLVNECGDWQDSEMAQSDAFSHSSAELAPP